MKTHLLLIVFMVGLVATMNAQIPTNGLIGSWPFNGNANDESGNGNNGAINGPSLTIDRFGNPNSAYFFDGINDYIEIPLNTLFNTDKFSISVWVKLNNTIGPTPDLYIINKGNDASQLQWRIYHQGVAPSADSSSLVNDVFTTSGRYIARDYIPVNQWINICMVNDSSHLKMYLNDSLVKSTSLSGVINKTSNNFTIGARIVGSNPGSFFIGEIDDIRIYDRALDSIEIASLYYENICSDISINDTTLYHVSDLSFENLSPKVYFNSIDSLYTSVGGCDSIIHHYSKYVFEPNYCTDTLWINDTITTQVFDTTFVTITDTTYISVTDTLIIDVDITGVNPPDNLNTLKIYPNPAKDYIYINTGDNYERMTDYKIKIISSSGSTIFETNVNQQLFEINLNDFGQTGLFFIQIINNSNQIIDTRKIILE
jgi:hypothetical protein